MKAIANLICGVSAATAVATSASATAYTDESAWREAVFNVYALETWDTAATPTQVDVGAVSNLGIRFLPLNDGTLPTVQPYSYTGGEQKSAPNNLLNDRDNTIPGRGPIDVVPLDAGDFLFGLGLWNVGGDDQLVLSFFDASDNLIESVRSDLAIGFFGIVNGAGATRAEVNFVQGNGYSPTDDWQTASREVFVPPGDSPGVPEPSMWVMLLIGFGAAGAVLRGVRRRAPSVI
jgi:hypothetical protein